MNYSYHINLVENTSTSYNRTTLDHQLVDQALKLYPKAKMAMEQFIKDGDHQAYIDAITEYDQFVWKYSHQGDKSNLFAYKKIKVSPTWTEQIWAPIFERVRIEIEKHWNTKLVLIQNLSVVESLGPNGPTAYKDVDGGIGIQKKFSSGIKIMPIVVSEKKTGHFCKTACTGVDSIIRRVISMNPNVLAFGITDNNISVGKEVEVDHSFGSGGILIQQRGLGSNKKQILYPKLDVDKFEKVERLCLSYLKTKKVEDFYNVKPSKTSGKFLRDTIDTTGMFVPPHLSSYLMSSSTI